MLRITRVLLSDLALVHVRRLRRYLRRSLPSLIVATLGVILVVRLRCVEFPLREGAVGLLRCCHRMLLLLLVVAWQGRHRRRLLAVVLWWRGVEVRRGLGSQRHLLAGVLLAVGSRALMAPVRRISGVDTVAALRP